MFCEFIWDIWYCDLGIKLIAPVDRFWFNLEVGC